MCGKKMEELLYEMYSDLIVMQRIKLARLRCAGHVVRMKTDDPARKVFFRPPTRTEWVIETGRCEGFHCISFTNTNYKKEKMSVRFADAINKAYTKWTEWTFGMVSQESEISFKWASIVRSALVILLVYFFFCLHNNMLVMNSSTKIIAQLMLSDQMYITTTTVNKWREYFKSPISN